MRLTGLMLLACAGLASAGLLDGFVSGVSKVGSGFGELIGVADRCDRDITRDFRQALYDFSLELFQKIAKRYNHHFVISQFSIWRELAGFAEISQGPAREELFRVLRLPQEECLRRKYYDLAMRLETPGNDVSLARKRIFIIDQGVPMNGDWANAVKITGLIDEILPMPLITDYTNSLNQIRQLMHADFPITDDMPAMGLMADSLDYSGLWTTAFADADVIPNVPFYDDDRRYVGTVDMMRMKKRVKLAQIPLLNTKALELPVGLNGRYKLIILINPSGLISRTVELFSSTLIFDMFNSLFESTIPLEISLPRFWMSSEYDDLRSPLQEMGVLGLWGSRGMAPTNMLQRVTVNVTNAGLELPVGRSGLIGSFSSAATGFVSAFGREFTADRPFIFGLVDAVTMIPLFSGVYSHPDNIASGIAGSPLQNIEQGVANPAVVAGNIANEAVGVVPQNIANEPIGVVSQNIANEAVGVVPQNIANEPIGVVPQNIANEAVVVVPQNIANEPLGVVPQNIANEAVGVVPQNIANEPLGVVPQNIANEAVGAVPQNIANEPIGVVPQTDPAASVIAEASIPANIVGGAAVGSL